MIIINQHKIVKAKFIEIIFEGSGDPSMTHKIKGVKFRDKDGNYFLGIGDIPCMPADKAELLNDV